MESNDVISLLMAAYKDKVNKEILNEVRDKLNCVIQADAEARRNKMATDIVQMNKLRNSLALFNIAYDKIKLESGPILALDQYVAEIQCMINAISRKKNHKLR